MTPEANIQICSKCQEKKIRIKTGKFPESKDNRYVDEWSMLWNGKMCPSCNKERVKLAMRAKRATTNQLN